MEAHQDVLEGVAPSNTPLLAVHQKRSTWNFPMTSVQQPSGIPSASSPPSDAAMLPHLSDLDLKRQPLINTRASLSFGRIQYYDVHNVYIQYIYIYTHILIYVNMYVLYEGRFKFFHVENVIFAKKILSPNFREPHVYL